MVLLRVTVGSIKIPSCTCTYLEEHIHLLSGIHREVFVGLRFRDTVHDRTVGISIQELMFPG